MTMTINPIQVNDTATKSSAFMAATGYEMAPVSAQRPEDTHPEPCPPWCTTPDDDPEPVHTSDYKTVHVFVNDGHPSELLVRLERGFPGQRRTGIGFCLGDQYFDLSLTEAAWLAGKLLALIFTAATSTRRRRAA